MVWEQRHQDVMEAFVRKMGLPGNVPGSDPEAREWIWKLAEQFAYSFPGEGWGTKRASDTRPPSTDVICVKQGSRILGWDILFHQGASDQKLNNLVGHHGEDMSNQVFLSVIPFNYIGNSVPNQPNPPAPPPAPTKLPWERGEMLDELFHLHHVYIVELMRPDGLWINGHPDFEGIAAWVLDVYQKERFAGKSRVEAREAYMEQIRNSDEYRQKHGLL